MQPARANESYTSVQPKTTISADEIFAHRAKKEATLDDGELAVYLGHITKYGTPAVQTTARYTQPSFDQIKEKLRKMKG